MSCYVVFLNIRYKIGLLLVIWGLLISVIKFGDGWVLEFYCIY